MTNDRDTVEDVRADLHGDGSQDDADRPPR